MLLPQHRIPGRECHCWFVQQWTPGTRFALLDKPAVAPYRTLFLAPQLDLIHPHITVLSAPHIVFAGGGSLGYLYPGLAIAECLTERLPGVQITFAGDGRPIERHTVNGAGYRYAAIACQPRPRNMLDGVRFLTDNAIGFCASRWMLKEQQASLVVGLGGHACGPVLRAAHGCGIPMVMLEQNAHPSLTSRWLASKVEVVCLGFEEARPHLPIAATTLLTGTPGRSAFERLQPKGNRRNRLSQPSSERVKRLVVIGGAGGAQSLNESTPTALARLAGQLDGWQIVHQTGEGQLLATEQRYQEAGIDALVVTYIDEMADLLRETDLILCRSGGCTIAELALSQTPAIFVPDTNSHHGSQLANAQILEKNGSCRFINETDGDLTKSLSHEIGLLISDEALRHQRAEAIADFARPEAACKIADICCQTLGVTTPTRRTAVAA